MFKMWPEKKEYKIDDINFDITITKDDEVTIFYRLALLFNKINNDDICNE